MTETAPTYSLPTPGMMAVMGRCGIAYDWVAFKTGMTPGSAVWSSANRCIYIPFEIERPDIVNKLWWVNGGTVGTNNIRCAIYRDDYTQFLLGASVLSAGANDVQFDDVTDTLITPGRYYFGMACNGTTATVFRLAPSLNTFAASVGVYMQATAFPPPDPMVPVQITVGIPLCGIQFRTSA